jgi:hypothetical protein
MEKKLEFGGALHVRLLEIWMTMDVAPSAVESCEKYLTE